MEQKYGAAMDKVFSILTDPKWLETRCLAVGELSASVKVKKQKGGGVALTMKRRVRRDLPGILARVMSSESDLVFEETWTPGEDGGWTGTLAMDAIGQPVKMTATFELAPSGKGCVYRITHKCKSGVMLIGGIVEKFAQEQVEKGCADEFAYLVGYLKKK